MTERPIAPSDGLDSARTLFAGARTWRAMMLNCVLLTAGLAGATMSAAAPMFKWVDSNGQTVYSDQPPPANVKAEIVKPPPPPSNPNALKEMVNADAEMKMRERQRVENAKEAEKARNDAAIKADNCTKALAQIKTLQREDLYRYDGKGQRTYLDADARRKETAEVQKVVRENCPA